MDKLNLVALIVAVCVLAAVYFYQKAERAKLQLELDNRKRKIDALREELNQTGKELAKVASVYDSVVVKYSAYLGKYGVDVKPLNLPGSSDGSES